MNTKEAIDFLEYDHKYKLNRNSAYNIKMHNEGIQEIIALILSGRGNKMFQNNEDRLVKALETIAESQIKMAQIAEQSFKEAKELRDVTMGMMKEDLKAGAKIEVIKDNLAACEDNSNENSDEDDEMFF